MTLIQIFFQKYLQIEILKKLLIIVPITNLKIYSIISFNHIESSEYILKSTFEAISIYLPKILTKEIKASSQNLISKSAINLRLLSAIKEQYKPIPNKHNQKLTPMNSQRSDETYECMINMWPLSSKWGAIYWPKSDKHIICNSWIPYYRFPWIW